MILTPKYVLEHLDHIRALAHDPESAHQAEDDLYATVLAAIACGGCSDPTELKAPVVAQLRRLLDVLDNS